MKRDPNRIPAVLAELEILWKMVPDMRLGQLLVNAAGGDPFSVEDDDMLKRIKVLADYPYTGKTQKAKEGEAE